MKDQKPREWWLWLDSGAIRGVGEEIAKPNSCQWKPTHVIEHSAYQSLEAHNEANHALLLRAEEKIEQLSKENEELRALKDKAADIAIAIGFEHNQKCKRITELEAEVARLKEELNAETNAAEALREQAKKLRW